MSDEIRVEFDVPATMRDGTVLRANIFRPAAADPAPVALARTPYGKDLGSVMPQLDAVRLARAGYIVVLQDVRGRFRSEGEWVPFAHEAADGYDTVQWAAALPGANGKVGMCGPSYLGFTAWAAAGQAPPALAALVPAITWADQRDGALWRGGAFELGLAAYWQTTALGIDLVLRRTQDAAPLDRLRAISTLVGEINRLRSEGYLSLPLRDFAPLKRLDLDPRFLHAIVAHPNSREHAAPFSPAAWYSAVTVPTYNVGGWYDIFGAGTLQNFRAMRTNGSTPAARAARVLMGPWSHVGYSDVIGEVEFGFAANMAFINLQTDLTGLTQRWFDYWLRGIENGVTQEPPVKLFIMGANTWRDEQEWPLARTQYTPYYLHSGGGANTGAGDGTLSAEPPGAEPPDHYTYDPADATPTRGGALLMHPLFGPGVKDQRPVEARPDVLVYTSAPLAADTEVTGPVQVRLWAASDAPDTDFVARLIDVHPDGFAQNLTDGIIRARYRDGDTPEPLEPGRPYAFTIDLWATANVFKAGHRIRLDVASANFPRWDRNPNTGGPFAADTTLVAARQTILHDADHPSHVVLPLIPRG